MKIKKIRLLAASDIFGKTIEFERLIARVESNFGQIDLLDPYNGESVNFINENEAYSYFQKNVGIKKYTELVSRTVKQFKEKTLLLGFSIGASAIWGISDQNIFHHETRAMCFYGSQIRHQLSINPRIKFDLFFPKEENHFSVTELISKLSTKQNVACFQTPYFHGHMNELSKNYQAKGLEESIEIIKRAAQNGTVRHNAPWESHAN